jgi:hypothetical protein
MSRKPGKQSDDEIQRVGQGHIFPYGGGGRSASYSGRNTSGRTVTFL